MLRIAASLLIACLLPAAWAGAETKDKRTWLVGDKLFVFPVNAFTRDEYRDRIVVEVERKQLAQSAGFDRSNWRASCAGRT